MANHPETAGMTRWLWLAGSFILAAAGFTALQAIAVLILIFTAS